MKKIAALAASYFEIFLNVDIVRGMDIIFYISSYILPAKCADMVIISLKKNFDDWQITSTPPYATLNPSEIGSNTQVVGIFFQPTNLEFVAILGI